MSAAEQLKEILERHCASLPGEITSASTKFSKAILAPAHYGDMAREVTEIVHRINGSSGSLGFRRLSSAADKFESALNESLVAGVCPDEAEIRRLHDLLSEMQSLGQQTQPKDSHLFGIDVSQFG
jgi:HPt (histidine-containing phosphotransfer) domain-containing protein